MTNTTNGASGGNVRDEALDAVRAAYNRLAEGDPQGSLAAAHIAEALGRVLIGDQIGRLVDNEHDPGDEAHRKLGQLDTGSLAGLFRSTERGEGER